MKNLILYSILILVIGFTSCGEDEDDPAIQTSEKDLMTEKLAKTWKVGSNSTVTVNSEDVTADFEGFTITMNASGSYTTNSGSLSRTPTPWPAIGVLNFGGSEESPNLNQLIRDDGLTIAISVSTDGSTLQMSFTFADENKDSTGGRVEVINGSWVFEFSV